MTKKHYINIAQALWIARDRQQQAEAHGWAFDCLEYITDELCIILKQDNPKFDAVKFRYESQK